ncbi:uncharacterized protein ACA1_337640 [Acanthamoeba castellanii str. Neff]|uniref:Uncharacterized protein n=1 Tax=Acanthamoeba castellanii (strain ATCC 30010 / Neff) TaxID=1257118 RepID=L8GPY6_ACACF|nr:uncharacterized protein ACA1_337640 [Acanthamoeba castellanii str. Neff]ELR14708.1 hypothetical protein ACA1_337640 [Acanthamoeba castellanii str. Neff]
MGTLNLSEAEPPVWTRMLVGQCTMGLLTLHTQIFHLVSHLHLLNFTKGWGDVLEYNHIYNMVLNTLHSTTTA